MFEIRLTAAFLDWLTGLKDIQGRARIAKRLDRMADGNFGDANPVGSGVSELRFAFGPDTEFILCNADGW
ncbi:type II toxin-antitoxin system RelE/ParE family toxin [Sandarakinorhabdus sp.]|uniref:type II toxin-antitoxin system RelE/ParE family toxin n=1 Tax=Sandarakinorhabdus sp. TaxID=1916663 RepID=UPI003F6EC30D